MTNVSIVQEVDRGRRQTRRPQHPFYLKAYPWGIYPCGIAPVLPGETMTNALFQARMVTSPLKNPLIGWWFEWFLFYVKLTDLDGRDDFQEMMIDDGKDLSAYHEAAAVQYYHQNANSIPWVKLAYKRVVEEYFRDEGEAWNTPTVRLASQASFGNTSWLQSMANDADVASYDVDLTDVGSTGGAAVTTREIEEEMRTWQFMRMQGLTEMSYEDYLRTFGIRRVIEGSHKPELLRYARNWQYPSNTVDPTSGAASSAVSFAVSERADKDRFFAEPGFVCSYVVARPKVYFNGQNSTATQLLDNAYAWLPAIMRDDPASSLRKIAATTPPLYANTDEYWVDLRDLFMYGEQYTNVWGSATIDFNDVDFPNAAGDRKYPSTEAAQEAPFSDNVTPNNWYEVDGVLSLTIRGSVKDTTPGSIVGV